MGPHDVEAGLVEPSLATKSQEGLGMLPPESSSRPLLIPEPAEAAKLVEKYRKTVPFQEGANRSRLQHIPPPYSDKSVGSVSLGGPSSGSLVEGRALPIDGAHVRILGRTQKRGTYYGTDELIRALENAGRRVHENFSGPRLSVGNISKRGGGDIPQSVSHNSGRDADVAFFVLDKKKGPVEPDWFSTFDGAGVAEDGSGVLFDAARNWRFVEALIEDSSIQVQYIFVATWLKDILIEYAIRSGASAEVVLRAENIMKQPQDSSPHAEHFHVRLYCDLIDRLHGCYDSGIVHTWVNTWNEAVEEKISRLIELYQSGVQSERDHALRQLDLLRMNRENESEDRGEETL